MTTYSREQESAQRPYRGVEFAGLASAMASCVSVKQNTFATLQSALGHVALFKMTRAFMHMVGNGAGHGDDVDMGVRRRRAFLNRFFPVCGVYGSYRSIG